jgi:hypothetical protein
MEWSLGGVGVEFEMYQAANRSVLKVLSLESASPSSYLDGGSIDPSFRQQTCPTSVVEIVVLFRP